MRNVAERKKKKKGAWICALIVVAFALAYLAVCLVPIIQEGFGDGFVIAFILFYGLIFIAVIGGVLIALRQRLKEIEGGEEDAATKY